MLTLPASPLGLDGSPKNYCKIAGGIFADEFIVLGIGNELSINPLTMIDSETLIFTIPALPLAEAEPVINEPSKTRNRDVFNLKFPAFPVPKLEAEILVWVGM